MLEIIFTLIMLVLLQAVLGFDNLLYISLESKKAPIDEQKRVRKIGILIAIVLRIVLLFLLVSIIDYFQEPFSFLSGGINDVVKFAFNGHSIIVLFGGGFIIYTAIKEIWHMISTKNLEESEMVDTKRSKSANAAIFSIVIMNLVFSFDSILTAVGLSDQLLIMIFAVIIALLIMLIFAKKVSEFVNNNPTVKMLALAFLIMIGTLLILDGAHVHVPKGYIYFSLVFSLFVEFLNQRLRQNKKTT